MNIKNFNRGLIALSFILPNIAFGAGLPTVCSNSQIQNGIGYLFDFVSCTITINIIPLLIAVAVVLFIWGIIQMYIDPNNEEQRKKGKTYAIWGLVGLFIMISIWGLVAILSNTFGVTGFIPQLSQ
jgi:uncharacterized membrane protein YidH (DUF202 family)